MKKFNFIMILWTMSLVCYSQTLHTIMMCNQNDRTLAIGNQAEVREMESLIPQLAKALGYNNNMHVHSGDEFTYTQMNNDINELTVSEDDIIIYYYASHGLNRGEDEWPHMAFSDRQYSSSKLYNTLLEKFPQAKLILCIAACCNMDEEGERRMKRKYASMDPQLVKSLFTDFEGHRAYLISSSIRGQYSWCWVGGPRPGHIFGIALRDAIQNACSGNLKPEWDYVFEAAKSQTLSDSQQKQMPQFTKKRW